MSRRRGRDADSPRRRVGRRSSVQTAANPQVLDEGDRLLDEGFERQVTQIVDAAARSRQTLCFSATMPADLERVLRSGAVKKDHARLDAAGAAGSVDATAARVDLTRVALPRGADALGALANAVLAHRGDAKGSKVVVFCATTAAAELASAYLARRGVDNDALHSRKSQGYRTRVLQPGRAPNRRGAFEMHLLLSAAWGRLVSERMRGGPTGRFPRRSRTRSATREWKRTTRCSWPRTSPRGASTTPACRSSSSLAVRRPASVESVAAAGARNVRVSSPLNIHVTAAASPRAVFHVAAAASPRAVFGKSARRKYGLREQCRRPRRRLAGAQTSRRDPSPPAGPDNREQFVHRAGRTGRAGAAGAATLLLESWEEGLAREMLSDVAGLADADPAPLLPAGDDAAASRAAMRTIAKDVRAKAYVGWLGHTNARAKALGWSKQARRPRLAVHPPRGVAATRAADDPGDVRARGPSGRPRPRPRRGRSRRGGGPRRGRHAAAARNPRRG